MTQKKHDKVDSTYPELWQSSWLLFVLFLAYTLSFIDRQILTLLVGPIQNDIGLSDFEISLLHGFAFAIFFSLAGLPLGRLADHANRRAGRRPPRSRRRTRCIAPWSGQFRHSGTWGASERGRSRESGKAGVL